MPSVWAGVDTNFPSFKEDEPSKSKMNKLLNYMYVLTEQLKYTLANLDTSNFNTAALNEWSEESTEGLAEEMTLLQNRISQLAGVVNGLSARVTTVEGYGPRISSDEESISALASAHNQLVIRVTDDETAATALEARVLQTENDIAAQELRLQTAEGQISGLRSDVDTNTAAIAQNTTDIGNNATAISGLDGRLTTAETAITTLANILDGLVSLITVSGNTVNIGGTGKNVNLLGTVKVNGNPI